MLRKLLAPFLAENVYLHTCVFAGAAVLILGGKVLGVQEMVVFAYLAPFITLLLVIGLVGSNLSWLLSQPVTKNQLMLASALLTLVNLLFLFVNLWLISGVHSLAEKTPKGLIKFAVEIYRSWHRIRAAIAEPFEPGASFYSVLLCLLCVCLVFLFPHRVTVNAQAGSPQAQGQNLARKRLKAIGVLLAMIVFFPLAVGSRLLSPFSIFAVITLLFPLAMMANSMTSLGFSHLYRRRWLRATAVLSLLCISIPFMIALRDLAPGRSPGTRYASVSFLGLFAGHWNQRAVLERFLKEDLKPNDACDAAGAYTAASTPGIFNDSERWWLAQRPGGLQFREVIDNKSDYYSMHEAGKIFDPRSLAPEDLDFYLDRARTLGTDGQRTQSDDRFHLGPNFWLLVPLAPAKVKELLVSDHYEAVDIGLIHVRFDPRKEYYEALLAAFKTGLPNRSVDNALYTLSTISSVPYAFRELASLETGKVAGREFVFHDCKGYEKRSADLRPEAQAIYGQCRRRQAFREKWLGAGNADQIGRRLAD